MGGIPVLMYHALEDNLHPAGSRDPGEQLYVLQAEHFRKQMDFLRGEGYSTILFKDLGRLDRFPEKTVVLTFDDGHESNYTLALPILKEFGFKAEFFITTGWIGTPYYLNENQIRALYDGGMGIGSHSHNHVFLTDLDEVSIEREARISSERLATILGNDVHTFSAPGGRIDIRVTRVLTEGGYTLACTSLPKLYTRECSRLAIPRFALRASDPFEFFCALVAKDNRLIAGINRREGMLKVFKKLLGNKLYAYMRSIFVR